MTCWMGPSTLRSFATLLEEWIWPNSSKIQTIHQLTSSHLIFQYVSPISPGPTTSETYHTTMIIPLWSTWTPKSRRRQSLGQDEICPPPKKKLEYQAMDSYLNCPWPMCRGVKTNLLHPFPYPFLDLSDLEFWQVLAVALGKGPLGLSLTQLALDLKLAAKQHFANTTSSGPDFWFPLGTSFKPSNLPQNFALLNL